MKKVTQKSNQAKTKAFIKKIRSQYPPKKRKEELELIKKESEQKIMEKVKAMWDSMVELPGE